MKFEKDDMGLMFMQSITYRETCVWTDKTSP
jgi:hypothetical protein